jgi:transposase
MARGKELGTGIKERIVSKHKDGLSLRQIAKDLVLTKSAVESLLKKYTATGSIANKPRYGRPKKLSMRQERSLQRAVKVEPRTTATALAKDMKTREKVTVSPEMIRRALRAAGLNGRVARKKPLLKQRHKVKRLQFAREHISKPESFWKKVLWSDETKVKLFESDGKTYVWRKPGEAHSEKNLVPTVKHGGGGVMVWGCMAAAGVGAVKFIDGIMDRFVYRDILKDSMLPSVKKLKLGRNFVFQHDNDPKHTSCLVKEFLAQKKVEALDWPAMSPDLNPIEQIWTELKKLVKRRNPSSVPDLRAIIEAEWAGLTSELCSKYVSTMKSRLSAVIAAKGGHTKY